MSKLTVTIPDDLHQQIRDELERQGITTSQLRQQDHNQHILKILGDDQNHHQ